MKILHPPLNDADVAFNLVRGLRALGQEADLATTAPSNPLIMTGNIDLSSPSKGKLGRQYAKWRFSRNELVNYNIVHYHSGHSILDYGNGIFRLMDMKQLTARGVPLFATFHGCEVRDLQPGGCPHPCASTVCRIDSQKQRERIEEIRRRVARCYVTTPDLLPAVPEAKLMPQSLWGLEERKPVPPKTSGPLRIVHAPSNRATKGTEAVIRAVESLQAEGLDIDFVLVENTPHDQALEILQTADVVIDHVQIDWYCVVSIEAAAFGKPVLVSFTQENVRRSNQESPPFLAVTKDTLKEKIRALYEDRAVLLELGRRNRVFAIKHHSAFEHAKRLLADYQEVLDARV